MQFPSTQTRTLSLIEQKATAIYFDLRCAGIRPASAWDTVEACYPLVSFDPTFVIWLLTPSMTLFDRRVDQ